MAISTKQTVEIKGEKNEYSNNKRFTVRYRE